MAPSSSKIIRQNFDGLNNLVKALSAGSGLVVRVGLMGSKGGQRSKSKASKETMTNAELGAIQEFGSISRKIPARSWLRMPIHKEAKQIIATSGAGGAEFLARGEIKPLFVRIGIACEAAIQRAFASAGFGTWKPNRPSTVRGKGSTMPLTDTGQLKRSVASKVARAS